MGKPNATKDIVDEIEKMLGIRNEENKVNHAIGAIR
jgi:hypothetical protein